MNESETRDALTRLYDALARRDGAAMSELYGPDASFDDPVFYLRGADIGRMWIALTRRAKEFDVSYAITQAEANHGVVQWTARYLFGGRHAVVNVIRSDIAFDGGKIIRQSDRFDFPRWAGQALGLPGRVLGRFRWFQRSVSRRATRGLGLGAPPL